MARRTANALVRSNWYSAFHQPVRLCAATVRVLCARKRRTRRGIIHGQRGAGHRQRPRTQRRPVANATQQAKRGTGGRGRWHRRLDHGGRLRRARPKQRIGALLPLLVQGLLHGGGGQQRGLGVPEGRVVGHGVVQEGVVVLRPLLVGGRADAGGINGRGQELAEVLQRLAHGRAVAGLPPHGFEVPAAGVGLVGHAQGPRIGPVQAAAQAGGRVVPLGPQKGVAVLVDVHAARKIGAAVAALRAEVDDVHAAGRRRCCRRPGGSRSAGSARG